MNEKRATSSIQPGSVFMTVNAYYQPMYFTDDNNGKYDFAHFLKDTVKFYCTYQKHLPDYWLFRCDLPDKTQIPDLYTFDKEDYPRRIMKNMIQHGLGPTAVLRLRDAAFCIEHGIDPLSEEGRHHTLIHNPDYVAKASRYGTGLHVIRAGEAVFPT